MRKFTEAQSRLEKIFGLAVELCAVAGMLVAQPSLRITSPPDGTTVHPGESLTVTVEASPPGAFRVVFVAGFEPIGFGKEETDKPPDKFTLQIPSSIRPDKYTVTAGGSVEPNHIISANPIHILVERIDYPVSMIVYPWLRTSRWTRSASYRSLDSTLTGQARISHNPAGSSMFRLRQVSLPFRRKVS